MRLVLAAAALCLLASSAVAADVRVLTAGAFKSVLSAVVPGFEQRTGHHVLIETDTAGGVAQRIGRGQGFDVAILTPSTAEGPARAGKLGTPMAVAAVDIGVAAREGAPKPDISTVPAFKQALLAARSVSLVDPASGGSSGIYMVKLFEQMGIHAAMRPKLVLVQGGLAADRVASGEAELAIQQQSELMGVPGVVVVGLIPAEVQNRTVYVAGLSPPAGEAARALVQALTGPETRAILVKRGMSPP